MVILKLIVYSLLLISGVNASELVDACKETSFGVIALKAKNTLQYYSTSEISAKYDRLRKEGSMDKDELEKREMTEMKLAHSVSDLELCETEAIKKSLEQQYLDRKTFVNACESGERPDFQVFDFSSDEKNENLSDDEFAKKIRDKFEEQGGQMLGDSDGSCKGQAKLLRSMSSGFWNQKSARDRCRYVANSLNKVRANSKICDSTEEKKFTDDQLFKCSMGEDPAKNCPNPDPDDVAAWESKNKEPTKPSNTSGLNSINKACERGVQSACESEVKIQNFKSRGGSAQKY